MAQPTLEVADIFRQYHLQYKQKYKLPFDHLKVISAIINCRTAALGGHIETCSAGCGYQQIAYNSCRNRHCPKCQFKKARDWMEARESELLPVPYFHVVFTIPTTQLLPIILPNKKIFYTLMFRCVSETLKTLTLDPKYLGAHTGSICVLHTWDQQLRLHPHIHCIVPAGGISPCGTKWIHPKNPDFFVPFSVLADLFRHKLLAGLKDLNQKDKLSFLDKDHHLQRSDEFTRFCQPLYIDPWNAFAKPSFNGPKSVIEYLGKYVHRIAISNWRLLSLENDHVSFTYRDRKNGNTLKDASLHALHFMKRFLQHVLPFQFTKIRAYGLLANRSKKKALAQARALLCDNSSAEPIPSVPNPESPSPSNDPSLSPPKQCPNCQKGTLISGLSLPPLPSASLCHTRSP